MTKIIIIIIITVLIAFTAGYCIGKIGSEKEITKYKTAIDEMFPEPIMEVFNVNGFIKEISGDSITIEIPAFMQRILPWEESQVLPNEERVVIVTKDTELTKIDPLIPIEFTEEGESIFGEPLLLSELKEGDDISVVSSQNIKTNNKFTATKIESIVLNLPENLPAEDMLE